MRPKDIRIRFLPVNDCAIVAPLGARTVFARRRVHASALGSDGGPVGRMPSAGRWKIPGRSMRPRRPFALVGGRRTAPRGVIGSRPRCGRAQTTHVSGFERKAYVVAWRGPEKGESTPFFGERELKRVSRKQAR